MKLIMVMMTVIMIGIFGMILTVIQLVDYDNR